MCLICKISMTFDSILRVLVDGVLANCQIGCDDLTRLF